MASSRSRSSIASSRSKSRSGKLESTPELQSDDVVEQRVIPDQLSWQFLSQAQVTKLKPLSPSELTKELSSMLSLTEHSLDLQQAAVLDYYVTSFVFSQENNFTDEQCSAFMTIIHKLINNVKDKRYSINDNLNQFKSYFTCVGISEYTPLRCFTLSIAQSVISYVQCSLIQHYKLFECLFEEQQQEELIETKLIVSLPPDSCTLSPPPLEEGVTEDFYNRFVSPPNQPSPSPSPIQEDSIENIPAASKEDDKTESVPVLLNVTPDDVKLIMTQLTKEKISTYQEELIHKLNDRETSYKSKFDKLEKALS